VFDPQPLCNIAVALFGQERSPQPPRQEAQFRLRPAANCRHQKRKLIGNYQISTPRGQGLFSPPFRAPMEKILFLSKHFSFRLAGVLYFPIACNLFEEGLRK